MAQFKKMFTSGRIGKLEIKNRVVMPAIGVSLAKINGEASDDMIRYYEERARGGVGLIITEITRVDDETGVGTYKQLSVTDPKVIPQLQRLVDTVHKYDCKLFVQLHHPGRETNEDLIGGKKMIAPSAIADKFVKQTPRAMTTEEVTAMVKKFIKGAVIAKAAGVDGVELHAAHGYLLNQFISPYSNKRTDRYGGSFHNRLRIVQEIISGIKYMNGQDYPVSVRISADEFVDGGMKIEDSIKVAKTLESYGADCINVSSGTYESAPTIIEPGSYPQGWKKNLSTQIKKNVSVPVIAVDNIKTPEFAEQLLEEDASDFIGIARASLADPAWSYKARTGQSDQITTCIGCLLCFQALSEGKHTVCAVNPRTGREREFSGLTKDGDGQSVVVIGGGPGGMEAAKTLADRNFKVTLFDSGDELGGTLNLAIVPPFKDKIELFRDHLINQVNKRENIEVRLGETATVENVKALDPVGVFIAAGAKPIIPMLPGMDGSTVVTAEDYLAEKAKVKGKVVVVGSGMTGLETAEKLINEGHEVTIVEKAKDIGPGMNPTLLIDQTTRMKKLDKAPVFMTNKQMIGASDQGIKTLDSIDHSMGVVPADTVVLSLGVAPDKTGTEPFVAAFPETKLIGDASQSGQIADAMKDGYTKAYVFEPEVVKQ